MGNSASKRRILTPHAPMSAVLAIFSKNDYMNLKKNNDLSKIRTQFTPILNENVILRAPRESKRFVFLHMFIGISLGNKFWSKMTEYLS